MPTSPPAIPADVEVVRSFVNTLDVAEGTDDLATPTALQRWLRAAQLVPASVPASGRDLALAHKLRKALRSALAIDRGGEPDPAASAALDAVLRDLPLTVVTAEGGLAPTAPGVRGGLGRIAVHMATAQVRGTWSRLKVCQDEECGWAFYDTSRNRSRRFCSNEVCGERAKARAARDRSSA